MSDAHHIAPAATALRLAAGASRLVALDWMRGLVMVLMTIDHASGPFNAGRFMRDAAWSWKPGTEIPDDQFLLRWITHLCAPTFVFLAGAALALTARRRTTTPEGARAFDRYLAVRGGILIGLDAAWMSLVFTPGRVLLQVLFAIGGGFLALIPLRRLSTTALFAVGLGLVFGCEGLILLARQAGIAGEWPVQMLLSGGPAGPVIFAYPLLPWLGIMVLGHTFGRVIPTWRRPARNLFLAGLVSLAVFAVVRGLDGYGNMGLHRDSTDLLQWLHVSKYPPAASFVTLELGLMALGLAAFFVIARARSGGDAARQMASYSNRRYPDARPAALEPLAILGATALFFYVLHAHLLGGAAYVFGLMKSTGIAGTLLASAICVVALLPLCELYRRYKARHPHGWTRYL